MQSWLPAGFEMELCYVVVLIIEKSFKKYYSDAY